MIEGEGGLQTAGESAAVGKQISLLPLLICACLSVFFINSGFFSFFFLAPLGFAAVVYSSPWLSFIMAAVINGCFLFVTRFLYPGSGGLWMGVFYFTALSMCFVLIMGDGFARIRTAYRFIFASAAATLAFLIFVAGNDSFFTAMIRDQVEIISLIFYPSEADMARQPFVPETIVEVIKNAALRGGVMASAFILFFVNRHAALAAVRVFKKQGNNERPLSAFFAPANTIWVFSSALAATLLATLIKIEFFEILAWNVLVVCAILFLAQGAGIVFFFLARKMSAFRLFANVLLILLIFSPGINTIVLAALLLLGIAENWLPLRVVKKDGQAPTPGL